MGIVTLVRTILIVPKTVPNRRVGLRAGLVGIVVTPVVADVSKRGVVGGDPFTPVSRYVLLYVQRDMLKDQDRASAPLFVSLVITL